MEKRSILKALGATLILLLIPLVGSWFGDQVNWHINDFLLMGLMIFVSGFIGLSILNIVKNIKLRWIAITILCLLFLLIWMELAVGIFLSMSDKLTDELGLMATSSS